jgi:hypothetical protein
VRTYIPIIKFGKKIKFVTRGDPWVSSFMKQKLFRTKLQREDVIHGMGGRIRTQRICIYVS